MKSLRQGGSVSAVGPRRGKFLAAGSEETPAQGVAFFFLFFSSQSGWLWASVSVSHKEVRRGREGEEE